LRGEAILKKIEAIIRQEKLQDLMNELNRHQIYGMTVYPVSGCGAQKGMTQLYRGQVLGLNLLPKMKVEMVVKDIWVDEVIEVINKVARTNEIGDGKIFVYSIEQIIRIRTGEIDEDAI